jgi:hypothetical protein
MKMMTDDKGLHAYTWQDVGLVQGLAVGTPSHSRGAETVERRTKKEQKDGTFRRSVNAPMEPILYGEGMGGVDGFDHLNGGTYGMAGNVITQFWPALFMIGMLGKASTNAFIALKHASARFKDLTHLRFNMEMHKVSLSVCPCVSVCVFRSPVVAASHTSMSMCQNQPPAPTTYRVFGWFDGCVCVILRPSTSDDLL